MAGNFKMPNKKTTIIVSIIIAILAIIAVTGTVIFLKDRGSTEAAELNNGQVSREEVTTTQDTPNEQTIQTQTTENVGGEEVEGTEEGTSATVDATQAGTTDAVTTSTTATETGTVTGTTTTTDTIQETTISRTEEVQIPERQISEGHYVGWTPMQINAKMASANIVAEKDDIEVTKKGNETVKQGDQVTYEIVVTNKTEKDMKSIEVKDRLDATILDTTNVEFIIEKENIVNLVSIPGTIDKNVITWNVDIEAGQTITIIFKATVKTDVKAGTILKNSVVANGVEIDKPVETIVEIATTDIEVEKEWKNIESDAAKAHTINSLIVKVKGNGITESKTISQDTKWKAEFKDLVKYDANGKLITYTISEEAVNDADKATLEKYYKSEIKDNKITNTFDLTKVDDKKKIIVEKEWVGDSEVAENVRPSDITINLENNKSVTMTVDDAVEENANKWSASIDVNKYDDNGKEIIYGYLNETTSVENVNKFASYTVKNVDQTEKDIVKITNEYKAPEVTDQTFTKDGTTEITSKDQEVEYTIKYSSVVNDYKGKATLTIVDQLPYEIDKSKSNIAGGEYNAENKTITWIKTIEGIDTYTNGQKTISEELTIKVVYVGMETTSGTFTNTAKGTLKLDEINKEETTDPDGQDTERKFKTKYTVTKKWENINAENISESIDIQLYADGKAQDDIVELSNTKGWTYTWNDIEKFDEKGNEISYSAKEVVINIEEDTVTPIENNGKNGNYKVTYESGEGTTTITNTFTKPEITVTKIQNKEQNAVVKHGDTVTYTITAENTGNAEGNVTIKDTIPENSVLAQNTNITVTQGNQTTIITKDELETGKVITLGEKVSNTNKAIITFIVTADGYAGNQIENVAEYKVEDETEFKTTNPPCIVKIEADAEAVPTSSTSVKVKQRVILCLDFSGSMNETISGRGSTTKINSLKTAVNNFLTEFLDGTNEVMIIKYSNDANIECAFTTSKDQAYGSIKNDRADGGTNIDAALTLANKNISQSDTNTSVILMTDGIPGRYIDNITNENVRLSNGNYYNEKCGDEAIESGGWIKAKGAKLYTIGFGLNDTGAKNMLEQIATSTTYNPDGTVKDNYYYSTVDGDALNKAFEDIVNSLTTDGKHIPLTTTNGKLEINQVVTENEETIQIFTEGQNVEIYTETYEQGKSTPIVIYSWDEFNKLSETEYEGGKITFNLGKYMEQNEIDKEKAITIRFVDPKDSSAESTTMFSANILSTVMSEIEEEVYNEETVETYAEKFDKAEQEKEITNVQQDTNITITNNTLQNNVGTATEGNNQTEGEKDEETTETQPDVEETKKEDSNTENNNSEKVEDIETSNVEEEKAEE